jgi:hypothetical protein
MKKVILLFSSLFFLFAFPAFADTSGGYGGTNVTVIDAPNGEVEIQNLECSAYNSFQLRLSDGSGGDLASGGTCSQNGSNADVTWSSYNFDAHGTVPNYIVAESFTFGTDWSNTFSYSPTGGTHGGYGGTNVSVINASAGEVEIQNLQCSAYNSFQLRISGNNNYGDLATGATCSQNGTNADVTWSSWDFNAHGAVSNYIVAESFTFGTDFSNAFSYASNAGTNVSVINASSGEVEIQNLVCSAYQSFQLRLSDGSGGDLASGATCSQNGSNADVTWSSYNFNSHGTVSNYIVAESGSYGTDFSNTFSYTPPANNPPVISSISNTTINEGATYSASGSFTDSDSSSWTATVDYGDGSGSQSLTLTGMNFSLSHVYTTHGTYTVTVNVTDNQGATGTGTATVTVQRQLVTLSPAKIWVGLKNSDDAGIKFDLLAEVYKDSSLVTSGELDSVAGGGSGFNNAHLQTISFNSFSPIDFPSGSNLKIKVSVRNACTGSAHNSGTARLWFNDSAADSHFDATIGTNTSDYFLLDNFLLGTSTGSTKKTIDVAAGAKCSAFKPFGTWTITP